MSSAFWSQPTRGFRNAQVLFALLGIGFGVAAVVYACCPGFVVDGFAQMDALLGGHGSYPEEQCRIWTSLAAANVATLSLMSVQLLRDLARKRALHLPLLFMKTTSALLFLSWFLVLPHARSLLFAFVGDLATGLLIWWVPRRAFAELDEKRSGAVSLWPAR